MHNPAPYGSPQYTAQLQQRKDDQIARLLRQIPSAACRDPPRRTIYDIGLKLTSASNTVLTMRIELLPKFPEVAPTLQIRDAGVIHPWLDAQGRVVGLNDIYNWGPNSDLGLVVQAAIAEFNLHPPRLVVPSSSSSPAPSSSQPAATASNGNHVGSTSRGGGDRQSPRGGNGSSNGFGLLPSVPDRFEELDKLSSSELQAMLDDDTKYLSLFNSLDAVATVVSLRDSITESNLTHASRNLDFKDEMDAALARVESLREEILKKRGELLHLLSASGASKFLSQYEPKEVARKLVEKAMESDRESEDLSDSFIRSSVNNNVSISATGQVSSSQSPQLDEVFERYAKLRKEHHLRMAKAAACEKM